MQKDIKAIQKCLKTLSNGSIVTTEDIRIHFPERFLTKGIAMEAQEYNCIGMFAIIHENKFAIMNAIAMLTMQPTDTRKFQYEGQSYVEWTFDKGSVFIKSKELVKNNNLVGIVFEEFISKGNVPYYYSYEDYYKILSSSEKYAGANLGASDTIMSVIASSIARWPTKTNFHYRQGLAHYTGKVLPTPKYIGLGDMNASTSTIARLRGVYFNRGISSSIMNPTQRLEETDVLIRR